MRLNEITDPRYHVRTDIGLASFLEELEELWPDTIADDDDTIQHPKKKLEPKKTKRSDRR